MLQAESCTAPLLPQLNQQLESFTAEQRIESALQELPGKHVLASSFGIQSAVMLHLVAQVAPDIDVVLVDTGYLFPETYDFIDKLTHRLQLNLTIVSNKLTPTWQERRYGRLWEQGAAGLRFYNQINKVEPMNRLLDEMGVNTWFSGIRRQQASTRADKPVVERLHERFKVHPIIDWGNRDVHRYLTRHQLPYHPLWEQGYASVGDWHSSRPLTAELTEEQTRFGGLLRECGLHQ